MKKFILSTLFASCIISLSFAQRTIRLTEPNATLKSADNFIRMSIYTQALLQLNDYLDPLQKKYKEATNFELETGRYMQLVCLVQLKRPQAQQNLMHFLDTVQYESIQQLGFFNMAKYFYAKGDFQSAIPYYEKSGIHYLTNKELSERNFDLAYSYLVTGDIEKVQPLMATVKNMPDDYFKPGNYYHGIMSYYKGNYDDAELSFKQVANDDNYKYAVPFYLAEIEYLKGNKEKALSDAKSYLKQAKKLYFHNELNQLVAQIQFEEGNYVEAENYLQTYIAACESPRREDYYRLAYAQLQQAKLDEAIVNFEKMNKNGDAISTLAYYNLANTYLMKGEKEKAYKNLLECTKNGGSNEIQENASYVIAKLSFDKKDDEVAEKQLVDFVNKFPASMNAKEASELLILLHIRNGNMTKAAAEIDALENASSKVREALQVENYRKGLQRLQENNPNESFPYFEESLKHPINLQIINLTQFCLAEASYRTQNFDDAIYYADNFLDGQNTNAEDQKKIHFLKAYIFNARNEAENVATELAPYTSTENASQLVSVAKLNMLPIEQPIANPDASIIVYNLPVQSSTFNYTPVPLKPLALNNKANVNSYMNYVTAAIGNLSTVKFGAGIDASTLFRNPSYLEFLHTGSNGKIKYQQTSLTHLGFGIINKYKQIEFNSKVDIDRTKYMYYGYNHDKYDYSNTDIKQVFGSFGIGTAIKGLRVVDKNIEFMPSLYAGLYLDKFQANETSFKFEAPAEKDINETLQLGFGLSGDLNYFSVKNFKSQSNSMLSLQASILKKWHGAKIRVGLYPTFAQKFHLLPDINVQLPVLSSHANLSVGLLSSLTLNTYKQLSTLNPFMFNNFNVKQSRQDEFFGSLHGNFSKNVSYSARIALGQVSNLPLFVNDTTGDFKQFNVLFDKKARIFKVDALLDYTINRNLLMGTSVHVMPILSLSTADYAWGYVPATWDLYGKMNVLPNLLVTAEVFMRAGSKALVLEPVGNLIHQSTLTGIVDANLRGQYAIYSQWNITAEFNNMLGSKYQRWNGYDNFGTNIQFGLTHSFNKPKFIPNNFFK